MQRSNLFMNVLFFLVLVYSYKRLAKNVTIKHCNILFLIFFGYLSLQNTQYNAFIYAKLSLMFTLYILLNTIAISIYIKVILSRTIVISTYTIAILLRTSIISCPTTVNVLLQLLISLTLFPFLLILITVLLRGLTNIS